VFTTKSKLQHQIHKTGSSKYSWHFLPWGQLETLQHVLWPWPAKRFHATCVHTQINLLEFRYLDLLTTWPSSLGKLFPTSSSQPAEHSVLLPQPLYLETVQVLPPVISWIIPLINLTVHIWNPSAVKTLLKHIYLSQYTTGTKQCANFDLEKAHAVNISLVSTINVDGGMSYEGQQWKTRPSLCPGTVPWPSGWGDVTCRKNWLWKKDLYALSLQNRSIRMS
jgi:hypothetical protein